MHSRGVVVVVSGPSGVGKGTVIGHLLQRRPSLRRSVSHTTRPPRDGEVEGRDYHFTSPEEFDRMRTAGEFLEWAVVHRQQSYGTARAPVVQAMEAGEEIVLEIDYQGAMSVRSRLPEAVLVFVAPPTWAELLRRLCRRHTESPDEIEKRVESAFRETENIPRYDYLLVNRDSRDTADQLACILEAERRRLSRLDWESLRDRLLAEAKGAGER